MSGHSRSITKIGIFIGVLLLLAVSIRIGLNSTNSVDSSSNSSVVLSSKFLSSLPGLDANEQAARILHKPEVKASLQAVMGDEYKQLLKGEDDLQPVSELVDKELLFAGGDHNDTIIWLDPKTGKCAVARLNDTGDGYRVYGAESEAEVPSSLRSYIGYPVPILYKQSTRSRIASVLAVTETVVEKKIRSAIPPNLRDLRLQRDVDEFLCYPFIQKQLLSVMGDDYCRFVKNSRAEGIEVTEDTQDKSDLNAIAESGAAFRDTSDNLSNEHLDGDEFSCTTFNGPSTVNTITYNEKTGKCMVLVQIDDEVRIYGAKPGEHWSKAIGAALDNLHDADEIKHIKYEMPQKITANPDATKRSPSLNKQGDPFSFLYGTWVIYSVVDDQPADPSDSWFHERTARAKNLKKQIGKKVRFGPDKIVYDENFLDLFDGAADQPSEKSAPCYSYHRACLINGPETGHEAQATLEFSSTGAATGQGVGVTVDGTWYEFTNLGELAVWDDRFFMFLKKVS